MKTDQNQCTCEGFLKWGYHGLPPNYPNYNGITIHLDRGISHFRNPPYRSTLPGRVPVLGEYGGLGYAVEGHQWSSTAWGYGEKEVNRDPAAGLTGKQR